MTLLIVALVFSGIGYAVGAAVAEKKIKEREADAETRGIEQGALLEAHAGWVKKNKSKKLKKKR